MSDPSPPVKKARSNDKVLLTKAEIKVIKIQFQKGDTSSCPRFNVLLTEYCRFLQIKVSETTKPFAPSVLIDKLWHAHILSTREYLAFCDRDNHGEYIHHDPTMKRGQERYQLTLAAYEKLFGEKPSNKDIWPDHVDEITPGADAVKKEAQIKQESDGTSNQNNGDGADESENEEEKQEHNHSDEYDSDEKEYLEEYGDERGRTREALAAWHKQFILEEIGDEAYKCSNCASGCKWVHDEFNLSCSDCRNTSDGIGGYSCG